MANTGKKFQETIFLTGFPGFIAGHLVERFAQQGAKFLFLVQPALRERAQEQIAELVALTGRPKTAFGVVEGDITRAGLGLSETATAKVREKATIVFHLAAVYDLGVERGLAQRVNVDGTRHVNNFVRELPKLKRYHYVSTCYVAGERAGLILESELRHNAGFRNAYEETKYLAEIEVEELKKALPVTIHRPSVVCGDSRTGATAKYDGVYYLINYLRGLPSLVSLANIGNHEIALNIVPVDFVVDAMVALAHEPEAEGVTVQLADPDPPTTHELFDMIARAVGKQSLFTLPRTLVQSTLNIPMTEWITGMPRVASPYFFLEQQYDTTQATSLLAKHGIECPRLRDYIRILVAYVEKHPHRPVG